MKRKKSASKNAAKLRRRAKARLAGQARRPKAKAEEETQREQFALERLDFEANQKALIENQRELELLRERYAELYDTAPVALVSLDRTGFLREANLTVTRMLGVPRDKLLNTLLSRFVVEGDRRKLLQHLSRCQRSSGGEEVSTELKMASADGQRLDVLLTSQTQLLRPKPLEQVRFRSVLSDITERKRSQAEVVWRAALLDLAHDAIFVRDMGSRIRYWNKGAEVTYGFKAAEVMGQITHSVLQTRFPKPLDDIMAELRRDGWWEGELLHTARDGRKVVAATRWSLQTDEQSRPVEILEINNDITERKAGEEELMAEKLFSDTLLDAPHDTVFLFDPATSKAVRWNHFFAEVSGYTDQEIAAMRAPHDFHDAADLRKAMEAIAKTTAEGRGIVELSLITKAGKRIPFEYDTTLVAVADSRKLLLAIGRNLTERRQAEAALRESEERYRFLVESVNDWIWEVDQNGVYTYASPQCREMLGYEPEELLGKTPFDLMPPEEAQRLREVFVSFSREVKPFRRLENVNRRKDGRLVVLETNGVPISDAHGKLAGYRGVDRDITERKQAEEALREHEQMVSAIVESSQDWIWAIDLNGRYTYSNPAVEAILGYSPAELQGMGLDLLHPEDRRIVDARWPGWVAVRQGWRNVVLRWRAKDGDYRHLESAAVPIFGSQGEMRGFRGVDRDVTERKQAEAALRKLSQAVEQSPASVIITDLRGNIEYVNRRYCEITGYTAAEVLGQNPRLLKSGKMPEEIYRQLWQTITTGREWDDELLNRRKDGTLFWERALISPIKDEQGRITHYLGIKEDITQQKQAAATVRQLSGRLLCVEDEERRRIARELHDTAAQEMAALSLSLTLLAERLPDLAMKPRELLDRAVALADQCAKGVRTLSYLLHPPLLDELGLAGAVRDFADGFAQRSGIRVDLELPGNPRRLPREIELALFRVLQESLANVHRHSHSKTVSIRLSQAASEAQLEVEDQGRGFAPSACALGVGISGMRERMRLLGGWLNIGSGTRGTTVRAIVPLPEGTA